MRKPNPYAAIGLDRASERRGDTAWIESLFDDPSSRLLPIWRSMSFVVPGEEPRVSVIEAKAARALSITPGDAVFLGLRDDIAHFALDVSHIDDPAAAQGLDGAGEFVELRSVGPLLSRDEGGILAYAKGITHWHARHRFCGACGTETVMREAGHVRVCVDDDCGSHHFPRTDPAVIMLVSQGDRVVLGRKSEWQADMYSTLAGFVEPGESLEDAVAREVWEEVRIEVANVRYHSSQPWPFPASLMLGFHADAVSDEIQFNRDELEDARWFTRQELADGGAGIKHRPRSDSIARRLILDWVAAG
jgi:NAD+ diphosphatase